mmetsp:Transcript_18380/g.41847  ORF Transcript_18380/g.41847 Transcript_18380/m.41847 type:complete len:321 (-) Transcript_18380:244-1206(-)
MRRTPSFPGLLTRLPLHRRPAGDPLHELLVELLGVPRLRERDQVLEDAQQGMRVLVNLPALYPQLRQVLKERIDLLLGYRCLPPHQLPQILHVPVVLPLQVFGPVTQAKELLFEALKEIEVLPSVRQLVLHSLQSDQQRLVSLGLSPLHHLYRHRILLHHRMRIFKLSAHLAEQLVYPLGAVGDLVGQVNPSFADRLVEQPDPQHIVEEVLHPLSLVCVRQARERVQVGSGQHALKRRRHLLLVDLALRVLSCLGQQRSDDQLVEMTHGGNVFSMLHLDRADALLDDCVLPLGVCSLLLELVLLLDVARVKAYLQPQSLK